MLLSRAAVLLFVVDILSTRVVVDVTVFNAPGAERFFGVPPLAASLGGFGVSHLIPWLSKKTSPILVTCGAMFCTTLGAVLIVMAWGETDDSALAVVGKLAASTFTKCTGHSIRLVLLSQIVAAQPLPLQPTWNDYAFFCLGIGAILLPPFAILLEHDPITATFSLCGLAAVSALVFLLGFRSRPNQHNDVGLEEEGTDSFLDLDEEADRAVGQTHPLHKHRRNSPSGLSILLRQQEFNPTFAEKIDQSLRHRVRRLSADGKFPLNRQGSYYAEEHVVGQMRELLFRKRKALGRLVAFATLGLQCVPGVLGYAMRLDDVEASDAAGMLVYLYFGFGVGHVVTRWYRPLLAGRCSLNVRHQMVMHGLVANLALLPIILMRPNTVWIPCVCACICSTATDVVSANAYILVKHTYPSADAHTTVRAVNGPFMFASVTANIIGNAVFLLKPDGMWPFMVEVTIAIVGILTIALVQRGIGKSEKLIRSEKRIRGVIHASDSATPPAPSEAAPCDTPRTKQPTAWSKRVCDWVYSEDAISAASNLCTTAFSAAQFAVFVAIKHGKAEA